MNWSGVKGEPEEGVDFNDWGLGVINEKDGKKGPFGSGVRGALGGDTAMSAGGSSVLELIHSSPWAAVGRGGDSTGMNLNWSAK